MPKMTTDYPTSINFPCSQEMKDSLEALRLSMRRGSGAETARYALEVGIKTLIDQLPEDVRKHHPEVLANVTAKNALKQKVARDAMKAAAASSDRKYPPPQALEEVEAPAEPEPTQS